MTKTTYEKLAFEPRLKGRLIVLEQLLPILIGYKNTFEHSKIGNSENGAEIPLVKVGHGPIKVLAWSQMHGNESTCTKALFDLLRFVAEHKDTDPKVGGFLKRYSFFIIPLLNPDGASVYTRENANGVDLNRDARTLGQKESQALLLAFQNIMPHFCFNMHDQRSIYGLENGKPAALSFLAPAADEARTITSARKKAMAQIVKMNAALQILIPGKVGRFDDSFNLDCVGDSFQKTGVPTILFEAGHFGTDYQRENSRFLVFTALLAFFGLTGQNGREPAFSEYFKIPVNRINYKDIILRNVRMATEKEIISIGIQFAETLNNGRLVFEPHIDAIGNLGTFYAHNEMDARGKEVLINSSDKFIVGQKVSIIVNKNEKSTIYSQ